MKRTISLTTAFAALFPVAAFAQSPTAAPPASTPAVQSVNPAPPVPPAPPAPPAPPRRHVHEHDDRPQEPVTFLGVETSEVPRVLSEQMNLPRGFGVVVDYVVPKSPAAEAGINPGDLVLRANRTAVGSVKALKDAVAKVEKGKALLLLVRPADGTDRFAALSPR